MAHSRCTAACTFSVQSIFGRVHAWGEPISSSLAAASDSRGERLGCRVSCLRSTFRCGCDESFGCGFIRYVIRPRMSEAVTVRPGRMSSTGELRVRPCIETWTCEILIPKFALHCKASSCSVQFQLLSARKLQS